MSQPWRLTARADQLRDEVAEMPLPALGLRRGRRINEVMEELRELVRKAEEGRLVAENRSRMEREDLERKLHHADKRTERARNNTERWQRRAKNAKQCERMARIRAQGEIDAVVAEAARQVDAVATENLTDLDPHGYFVYVLWGDDAPLYVGQSSNILSRLGSHLGNGEKRPHVRRVTVTRCATEQDMDALEKRLIRLHRPPWNRVGYTKINSKVPTDSDFSLTLAAVDPPGKMASPAKMSIPS